MTIEQIKEAIARYFSDTRRQPEETLEGLEILADEIQTRIDALKEDLGEEF